MGYTNYWHQYNDFTDEQWNKIKEEYENYVKPLAVNFQKKNQKENIKNKIYLFIFVKLEWLNMIFMYGIY